DGQSKPVVLMLSDGGPDENSCHKKTIQVIIEHFIKYDLDTIIVVCFALHQSASNPVERRMAPLSHDLAGIILPHDTFGSHLDEQLKTANDELENRNFKAAGEILASVYPVLVEYVDPKEHYQSRLDEKSAAWTFPQQDSSILPNQFFPSPILVQQKSHNICAASINASDDTTHFSNFLLSTLMAGKLISPEMNLQRFPFDWYSPTINKSINDNDKSEAMWIKEDTIPEDAPESLFQEVKHIRTNKDNQAYLIDWETWKPEWTNNE
ncbi:16527_t:CDS:2, partial [Gigaspora rosea]